jgi:hypothetical protein
VPTTKAATSGKTKFHDHALELFSKMVDNSVGMLQTFKNANARLEQVDNHMATSLKSFELLAMY